MRQALAFALLIAAISIQAFALSGCALLLHEAPVLEIGCSHLSCAANPEIVDGDLDTQGVLQSTPGVERGGAGVLIKLDEPTYIKHIEIYAASRVSDVRIYAAANEPKGDADIPFEHVRYYAKDSGMVERGQVRRFEIGREVLYLKLLTGWTVDYTSGRKIGKSTALGYNRVIPMIGPVVREVKFYTIRRNNRAIGSAGNMAGRERMDL